jgi:hypothetical protein
VQDEVERHVGIGHLYSAKNLFGIVDVDVTCNRKTEQSHGFLTMHHQDHPRFSRALELRDFAHPHGLEHLLLQQWLDRREDEE